MPEANSALWNNIVFNTLTDTGTVQGALRAYSRFRYEVTATGYGTYEYKGRTYRSLSAIALLITGSKWNGKQFFGLS